MRSSRVLVKTMGVAATALFLLFLLFLPAPRQTTFAAQKSHIGTLLGRFISPINDETSGIAVSRRQSAALFWVHNDSGDGPFLYAVRPSGKIEAVVRVPGAVSADWEDIAWGPGPDGAGDFLYVGDIGDNSNRRDDCTVYRLREPELPIGANRSSKDAPLLAEGPVIARRFVYPDGPHDAETLLVHPQTGAVYVVTKTGTGLSGVYKFPPEQQVQPQKTVTLRKIATLTVPEEFSLIPRRITGGSVSPDGRRVALCTYFSGYELTLPSGEKDFDAIWKTPLRPFNLPPMRQTEAITYARDGKSVIVTSEGIHAPIYRVKR